MNNKNLAIKAESISKIYRIGTKSNMHDSFSATLFNLLKSPINNYRKYRSLYNFDDAISTLHPDGGNNHADVIWALRDISFEVKQGEVVGIIGRNGAGKSTLLKVLCRITNPTCGSAEIRGRISSLLEVGTGFHPELTGRENIYLNGTILGMRKQEVDRKFDEIVDFSGVEGFINTPVKRYSSGMRVRLAFSVAAHLEPEILIIDEVLAVGDADFQKKCLDKMENAGHQGRTVIFVSHSMPAVTRLCQRAFLLEEGKILEDGPANQVVSSYLTSDLGTTAAREWPDPAKAPAGPIARLRAVRAKKESGEVSETFDIRHPIIVEIEYEVLKPDHLLLVHFSLMNELGQCAFTSLDMDPAWRGRPRPKGSYLSRAVIPENFLSEGIMYISCHCLILNPDKLEFQEKMAVAFNVTDTLEGNSARGDYPRQIPGVVRPKLDWTTRYDSEL